MCQFERTLKKAALRRLRETRNPHTGIIMRCLTQGFLLALVTRYEVNFSPTELDAFLSVVKRAVLRHEDVAVTCIEAVQEAQQERARYLRTQSQLTLDYSLLGKDRPGSGASVHSIKAAATGRAVKSSSSSSRRSPTRLVGHESGPNYELPYSLPPFGIRVKGNTQKDVSWVKPEHLQTIVGPNKIKYVWNIEIIINHAPLINPI